MTDKFMSMRNLRFTLFSRGGKYIPETPDYLNGHTPKTIDMIFKASHEVAKHIMYPMFEEMDRKPPFMENGNVRVHEGVRPMLETLGKDGWTAAGFPEKWKGENMPASLLLSINFIFAAANYSASVYAGLTTGAAKLILSFGSQHLQNTYIPQMLSGKWQGTMALTEPEAGTSLGDLSTEAVPMGKGQYKINGEKIFTSAGDHDGVDNVVHLLLARVKGAPEGVKGISLFVVPKFRPDDKNSLSGNDVIVTQVFHKLGYRGAPITGLRFGERDNCIGWIIGKENHGLFYMFQMMNNARLEVGMGATAIATAAYHSALDYCRSRRQGRKRGDQKNREPVPIIRHPDVSRMLLFQRAVAEGSLSLILQCGMYEDIIAEDPSRKDCHLLLELLTPVAKTYPSEMGILATSNAIQCFGGYGYCDDFPVEHYFRDMRIHTIHEGTTGIQALDLLGRKIVMADGRALILLKEEIKDAVKEAEKHDDLLEMAGEMERYLLLLEKTTRTLGGLAVKKGHEIYLADATLYLEMFGILVIAWQWLIMAEKAALPLDYKISGNIRPNKKERLFYQGKLHVARYFFSHELPRMEGLAKTVSRESKVSIEMPDNCFTD